MYIHVYGIIMYRITILYRKHSAVGAYLVPNNIHLKVQFDDRRNGGNNILGIYYFFLHKSPINPLISLLTIYRVIYCT